MKNKLSCLLLILSLPAHAHYAAISIQPHNKTAYPNKQFEATAIVQFGIQNNTYQTQTYTIKYSLCPENKHCLTGQKSITLASTDRISDSFKLSMPLVYGLQGGYRLTGTAEIIGESAYKDSKDATITVYY